MEYFINRPEHVVDVVRSAAKTTSRLVEKRAPRPSLSCAELTKLAPHQARGLVLGGRYRLERLLGRGGMGVVYLAEQIGLGRKVAIKILDTDKQDASHAIARFVYEAQLAARVRHLNVVEVFDCGSTPEGIVYIVMEHLAGYDLRTVLRQGPLDWRWARYMMCQVGAGLSAIHEAGIVHRDLKASNCVFVDRSTTVKVVDFGVATTGGHEHSSIVGTPEYMSPEQIRGESIDCRADIYSAGVLLYELLTGVTPFRGYTPEALFSQHLHDEVPPLASVAPQRDLPPGLDPIIARALAKDPQDRFESIGDFCLMLSSVDQPRSSAGWLRRLLHVEEVRLPRAPLVSMHVHPPAQGPEQFSGRGMSHSGTGVRARTVEWATTMAKPMDSVVTSVCQ